GHLTHLLRQGGILMSHENVMPRALEKNLDVCARHSPSLRQIDDHHPSNSVLTLLDRHYADVCKQARRQIGEQVVRRRVAHEQPVSRLNFTVAELKVVAVNAFPDS